MSVHTYKSLPTGSDVVVRFLRDGRAAGDAQATLTILEDSVALYGGRAIFHKILADYGAAIAKHRAQARGVVVVALDMPAATYTAVLEGSGAGRVSRVLDCFSDPCGWEGAASGGDARGDGGGELVYRGAGGLAGILELVEAAAAALQGGGGGGDGSCAVVIDSLSVALGRHTFRDVARFLEGLRDFPAVSSVLAAGVHVDAHDLKASQSLEYLASCTAALLPLPHPPGGAGRVGGALGDPHGLFEVRTKRRQARVKVSRSAYWLQKGGGEQGAVRMAPPPTPRVDAGGAIGGTGRSAPQVPMKMGLSEKERRARELVVLPYEHQGGGGARGAYERGDFKAYLPPAAGGQGPGRGGEGAEEGKLGHIMYVRDSDDDFDSDEDPDDDLDI